MSVVKINSVEVPEGMDDVFAERFAKRAGQVEASPGFEEFQLLKPTDGKRTWFVLTRWASEEAFEAWVASNDFAKAHAHVASGEGAPAGHGGPAAHGAPGGAGGPVAASAQLLSFEVLERVAKPS